MALYYDETILPLTGGFDVMGTEERPFKAYMHIPLGGTPFLILTLAGGGGAPPDVLAYMWAGQPDVEIDLRGIQPSEMLVAGLPLGHYKIWFT